MKIVDEDGTYIVPYSDNPLVLISDGCKEKLINCLSVFFGDKKRTKCSVYDENGNEIKCQEANFIYIPENVSVDNNMTFKQKTLLNTEISKIVIENSENFLSLEKIRSSLKELSTDSGMYRLRKILSNGMERVLDLEFDGLDLSLMLQNFRIGSEETSYSEKMMALYNLLLYLHRDTYNIIYIDFEIDDNTKKWLRNIKNKNNTVLVDNDSISDSRMAFGFDGLVLNGADFLEESECENSELCALSYVFNDYVKQNLNMQIEKNIEMYNKYSDKSSTFFLKTTAEELQKSL